MAITQSFSMPKEVEERLSLMIKQDGRTRSNFLQWLINMEWDRRIGDRIKAASYYAVEDEK